jgi:hypothetical protein
MTERTGPGGRRFGRNFNYQKWAVGGLRFVESDAGPATENEDAEPEHVEEARVEVAGVDGPRVGDPWGEDTGQGLDEMSQRDVDDSSYDYDDVPNRFDIDGYGSGLFGGPGADLFGAHGLPDSVPEQLPYTTGPQPVVRREENPAAESGSLVRPYTRTGGRTRPDYDLAIEALVSTSERGLERDAAVLPEHRSICGLCTDTRSVAEVAAHLRLPLGVVRVLIGDMASMGLVLIHQGGLVMGDRPSIEFLERVLSGLRRL